MGGCEAGDPVAGGVEQHRVAGLGGLDPEPDREVGLPDPGSEGERLQQLRAVLPCEVRVTAAPHPLFGRALTAAAFKRVNGVVHLVVTLPDGSPGTIRADATDVLGLVAPVAASVVVLDAAGLRELQRLVMAMRGGCRVGSPRRTRK
jgi:hypothetical protein